MAEEEQSGSVAWKTETRTETRTVVTRVYHTQRYWTPISGDVTTDSQYLKTIEGILRLAGIVRIFFLSPLSVSFRLLVIGLVPVFKLTHI